VLLTPAARRALVGLALLLLALLAPSAAAAQPAFPAVIGLPNGFQPEGIAVGRGTSFYVGSIPTGAIYRGSLRTGRGAVLVPARPGRAAIGIEVDPRNRLWVSGGTTGEAYVYDARTGRELAAFTLAPRGSSTFVNDVVVTRRAAYFTDSRNQRLYVVPLRGARAFGTPRALPLTGDFVSGEGNNANGIDATPTGKTLLVGQSNLGRVYRVDPSTGVTSRIDLGPGVTLPNADGILLRGRRLYVVQNRLNRVAVVRLEGSLARGTVAGTLTRPEFDVPTTLAAFRGALYAVNARFGTPPGPAVPYTVVRLGANSSG
jgi:sugar lactone lactonase YvrE